MFHQSTFPPERGNVTLHFLYNLFIHLLINFFFFSQVAEYESLSPREEEYRRLLDRLERVTVENQQLRDNNDELLSQMDSFPLRQSNTRNR